VSAFKLVSSSSLTLSHPRPFSQPLSLSLSHARSQVAVIVCAFGLFLFLLPPIPGVPVYLFAGVVLVASLEDSLGFWPAVFLTSLLCLGIKLTACTIQQKVRRFVKSRGLATAAGRPRAEDTARSACGEVRSRTRGKGRSGGQPPTAMQKLRIVMIRVRRGATENGP
jgi:hypothetical protein